MSQQTGRPHRPTQDRPGLRDSRHHRTPSAVYARRRLVALVLALAVVGLLVVLAAFVWPGFASGGGSKEPTVTVTAPPATPTIDPVERTAETELAKAMPGSVLQFALRAEAPTEALADTGAIEGHELTYADAVGEDATAVTVLVGQWGTDDEAKDAYDDLVAAAVAAGGDATSTGKVEVDGEPVGGFSVTPADAGAATVTWRNGTVVLQATGPADTIETFYTAFPL